LGTASRLLTLFIYEGPRVDPKAADEPGSEPTPGVLLHMVGNALRYGMEREEPHLRIELLLPKDVMEYLWTEAANMLITKATLGVKVEVFQSEVDRSLAEPWHYQIYSIENNSANTAILRHLRLEQSAVLPSS
jgi:hypothetical protein